MLKTRKTAFVKKVVKALRTYNWKQVPIDSSGRIHKNKVSALFLAFKETYPSVCPSATYYKALVRSVLVYKLSEEEILGKYICSICRNKPVYIYPALGKRWMQTCTSDACAIELRRRTNLARGGHTCPLHRKDIRDKVEEAFQKNWGVKHVWEIEGLKERRFLTNIGRYGSPNPIGDTFVSWKAQKTCIERYGAAFSCCAESSIREKIDATLQLEETTRKRRETMKRRGTIGCNSKEERLLFRELKKYFPYVIRQYSDNRYPFKCDFYIPDIDLFIEYQGYFFHGDRPYNSKDPCCKKLVQKWKYRASRRYKEGKHAKFYSNAVLVYTDLDVRKREVAKEKGLAWLEFFTKEELLGWLEGLSFA